MRTIGAVSAIKARAPVLGGNFGVWGGLFSTYDCAVKSIRQKEDPWKYFPASEGGPLILSAIIAGFFTGGSLAIRGNPLTPLFIRFPHFLCWFSVLRVFVAGPRSMRNSAIGCACLLAVFEGVGITMQRTFAQAPMVAPFVQLIALLSYRPHMPWC